MLFLSVFIIIWCKWKGIGGAIGMVWRMNKISAHYTSSSTSNGRMLVLNVADSIMGYLFTSTVEYNTPKHCLAMDIHLTPN